MQIACVLNRDGKFTPRWLKQFLEFSACSISLAQFGFQISPSVMDHSLPINSSSCSNLGLVQIVSVFNRDGKFSSFVEHFLEFCASSICLASQIANFLPSLGLRFVFVEF